MTDPGSSWARTASVLPVVGAILAIAGAIGAVAILANDGGPSPTVAPSSVAERSLEPRPSDALCRATLQAEVDATAPGETVDLRGCVYKGGATIDHPITLRGGTVHVPAGEAGIRVEADGVTLDGMVLVGAQASTYAFDEVGILAWATPGAPIHDLVIRDTEIASFGGFGAYLRNVTDIRLEANDVHDIVYAGLMVLSGTGGTIQDNVVRRIGLEGAEANANNAYGIALTTQGESEPRTRDIVVVGNTVEDVQTWHALDTHGGQHLVFRDNTVRRSMRGIFITADSAGHDPEDIAILDNRLLSPAPVNTNLAAITLYHARNVVIFGNTAVGWGRNGFLRDSDDASTGVVLDGNTVEP
jgi:hypothetical protein